MKEPSSLTLHLLLKWLKTPLFGLLTFGLLACGTPPTDTTTPTDNDKQERPAGWTTASHSKDAKADYDKVFSLTKVHRLDITITADNWKKMMDQMTEMMGEFGAGKGQNPGGPGGNPGGAPSAEDLKAMVAACKDKQEKDACSLIINNRKMEGSCGKAPTGDDIVCTPQGGPGGDRPGGPGGNNGGTNPVVATLVVEKQT